MSDERVRVATRYAHLLQIQKTIKVQTIVRIEYAFATSNRALVFVGPTSLDAPTTIVTTNGVESTSRDFVFARTSTIGIGTFAAARREIVGWSMGVHDTRNRIGHCRTDEYPDYEPWAVYFLRGEIDLERGREKS